MDEIKRTLSPLTDRLPEGARDFLDRGGWWLVLALAILLVLLVLRWLLRRVWRLFFGTRTAPPKDWAEGLRIDLESCPLPPRSPGARRLGVYHLPARLRLVVAAPAGTEADVDATAVEKLLDRVLPGLGDVARHDRPMVRVWPAQLSHQGFAVAFHRRTPTPGPEGEPSRWVLIAGKAQVGRQPVLLGLGLWTDEPCTVGRLTLEPHQWLDVLRLREKDG